MPVETVDLDPASGSSFTAELTLPGGETDHGAVLLPGANHGPYGGVFDRLAETAADSGVAFLRYETWEDGETLSEKPTEEIAAEFAAAVEYLDDRGCDRITVVGKSVGGVIALEDAPDRVDDMVLWAPAIFREDGAALDLVEYPDDASPATIDAESLATIDCPVTILQGDADHIPVENARELADGLPAGSVHVVAGADHSFTDDGEDETIETTRDLLTRPLDR